MKPCLLVLSLLLLVSIAGAQRPVMTADVPFDFVANDTSLAAGHYTVMSVSPSILAFKNQDSLNTTWVLVRTSNPNAACEGTKLTFARDDDQIVLHRVCREGDYRFFDLLHGSDVYQPALPE